MDPNYYSGATGTRAHLFLVAGTNVPVTGASPPLQVWSAGLNTSSKSTAQNSLGAATVIQVSATDGNLYVWYCYSSGKTGSTEPTFPAPAVFTGSLSASGLLTVTAMQAGSPNIEVNSYVTMGGTIAQCKITSFGTGSGGIGTYNTNFTGGAFGPAGMYAAPLVTDNTTVWAYGTEYYSQTSTAICVNTPAGDSETAVLVAYAARANTILACFDASGSTMIGPYAAAFRLASGQHIDFTGGGTQATLNNHVLGYSSYAGADTLYYASNGVNKLLIPDSGTIFLNGTTAIANSGSNLSGVTTGYAYPGLTIGVNQTGENEVDLIGGPNGFMFFNATTAGNISAGPAFEVNASRVKCHLPLALSSAFTSGAPTATGYVKVYDNSGTERRLLCA